MQRVVAITFLLLGAAVPTLPAADTLRGTVSEKMCGADHHGQDPAECTARCVKNGSPYVLVLSREKILDISNQKETKISAGLARYAGRAVTVTGTVSKDGKSVRIDTIEAAK